jgi:hypothetical protein
MTLQPTYPKRLAEVVSLSLTLSRQVLAALIMKHTIPAEQAIALAQAARLLQDNDVGWPPLLAQVVCELASNADKAAVPPQGVTVIQFRERKP